MSLTSQFEYYHRSHVVGILPGILDLLYEVVASELSGQVGAVKRPLVVVSEVQVVFGLSASL